MRAALSWEAWRRRYEFLAVLVVLVPYSVRALDLDPLKSVLFFLVATQFVFWGGIIALFADYRRRVREAGRSELGQRLLLPPGPLGVVLPGLLAELGVLLLLTLGMAAASGLALGPHYPEAPGEVLRAAVYLFLAVGAPALGLALLAGALAVAYRIGRAGGAAAVVAVFGLASQIGYAGQVLERLGVDLLAGPEVYVGRFTWLLGLGSPFVLLRPDGAWPAWPVVVGPLLLVLFAWLATRILAESEI